MIKWLKKKNGIASLLMGIGTVLVGYFAWGLLTVFHKNGLFGVAAFFFSVLTMLFYALLCRILSLTEKVELNRQIMVISGFAFWISLLLLLRGGIALFWQREYAKLLINFLWLVDFAGCCLYLGNRVRQNTNEKDKKISCGFCFNDGIRMAWSKHKWLYILLVLTLIFLIEPCAVQFKWDGLLYYLACQELSLDSISSLAPYGHIAQTYGMLNGIGVLIVGDAATAMIGLNIILLLCSICAFYGIIKCIVPGKSDFVYALATAVYAWSPFTLGMVFYHNLDFYCQCFFVIMLCFLYRRQYIYFFVSSMLFCFTKEPAILIYGAVCAGIVILDFASQKGWAFKMRIEKLLRTKQYYFMVLPGVLWLATYKILGPWSGGVGVFQLDGTYVIEKLKVLYIFQFNWLFTGLCICGIFFSVVKKRGKVLRPLFPIICGQIAFTVFSCAFKTVNHPRYNGAGQPALYCMAILLFVCLLEHLYGQVIAGGIAVIMLVSCFYTFDPVMRLCFSQYDIGEAVMATTDVIPLGDGMIYNRQMLWLEHAIEMALKDSLTQGDIVLFPALGGSTYFFDGMAKTTSVDSNYYVGQEYWDTDKCSRATEPGDAVQIFTVGHLAETQDWDMLEKEINGKASYCYLSCAGERCAEEIREYFQVLEEKEYAYRGWRVHRICFK